MLRHGTSLRIVVALVVGVSVVAPPRALQAQRGGGGGGGRNSMPVICVHDCSTSREGLSSEDGLKNFRRSMAIQATAEQRAAFLKISQFTQTASDRLKDLHESLPKISPSASLSAGASAFDQSVAAARAGNQNFLTSFSAMQKSELREKLRKLEKVDSELDKQLKTFDQFVHSAQSGAEPTSNSAATLDKTLASFQNEQLALGAEMSILFDPAAEAVLFSLPAVPISIDIGGQPFSILASGAVSRPTTAAASTVSGRHVYVLQLVADLSDLQQHVIAMLKSALNRSPVCGERIEVLDATLNPLAPASLLTANMHFERWVCPRGQSPMEVAEGNATIDVKLTPSLEPHPETKPDTKSETVPEPPAGLYLVSEITRVEAQGLLRNSLLSGDLGATLRDRIAASILPVLQRVSDLKATLPPIAEQSATLQNISFQNAGADELNLVLDGQLRFSDEQTQQFAAQLKQRLSAEGTTLR
jgi:hypothetical protein